MDIKFWNQPKDLCLGDILNDKLKKGFEKVWLIGGVAKDTGIEMLLESIEVARNMETEVNVFLGIDRKNISKDMLMKLLNLKCNLFLHINRDDDKVETRIYIFESADKESYIYESSGKFSEGGLFTSKLTVQEISYLPSELKMFQNAKNTILQGAEVFNKTDEEELKLLAERGEVVARIIERKIPSISEMYGNVSIESIGNDVYDENSFEKMFDIEKNNFDIDVDIDFGGELKKAELSVETEAKKEKKEKENLEKVAEKKLSKFYKKDVKQDVENRGTIIKDINNIDFSNMNIFVLELNKMTAEGEIKLPIYLYQEISKFFESDKFEDFIDEKGKNRFGIKTKLKIIDADNNESEIDNNALIYVESRYFAINSKIFQKIDPKEKDIVRIIRDDNGFCIELIRKDSKEYNIWENFCIYTMKNSKRKFGIM